MSDEVAKQVEEVVPEVPEVPAVDDAPVVAVEEAPEPATAAAVAAPEEKKKSGGGVARRFTFNKRWGKHRDAEAAPKEPEAQKDPKEDVLGWIAQQIPQAVHKANYQVIDWVQKTAIADESERKAIPGKDQSTTRNQFLGFFKDGDVLVKLANALEPGAIEPAVATAPAAPAATEESAPAAPAAPAADASAQKEAQKKNIDAFGAWAQKALGAESAPVSSDDLLEKGKAGYSAVFQTLWQLGVQAKDKFNAEGFDVDTIVQLASSVVKSGLLSTILGFFRRNRQATPAAAAVEEPKEEEGAAAEAQPEPEAAKEPEETVDEPVAVKLETSAPAAVAAN